MPFSFYESSRYDKRTDKTYHHSTIQHKTNTLFNNIYHTFYPDGKKVVTQEILDTLTPESIAIWYCDDGNYYVNKKNYITHITLSVQGFCDDEISLIQNYFSSVHDVQFDISSQRTLRLAKVAKIKHFMSLFAPHIPECMSYKKMEGY